MLNEIGEVDQRQGRDDETKPGQLPWEKTAEEHRAADDVEGDQTPKQAKADEEQSVGLNAAEKMLERRISGRPAFTWRAASGLTQSN